MVEEADTFEVPGLSVSFGFAGLALGSKVLGLRVLGFRVKVLGVRVWGL